jgi:hypothetical protein
VIFDTCMHGRIDYMETFFFSRLRTNMIFFFTTTGIWM